MRVPYSCNLLNDAGRHVHQFDGWLYVERDGRQWIVEGVFSGDRHDTHNMLLGNRLETAIADEVAAIATKEIEDHGKLAGFLADQYLQAAE